MSSLTFRSSRPDAWSSPRPVCDASMRRRAYGPIQPMQRPGVFARLLRRR